MKNRFGFAFLLLSVCMGFPSLSAGASENGMLELVYWSPNLEADGRFIEHGVGTDMDFQKDLGMKDKAYPEIRLNILPGEHSRLRLAYGSLKLEGDEYIRRTIEFNGQTYEVGTRVVSDLKLKSLRFGWMWQFAHNRENTFRFGTLLEAKAYSADARLKAPELQPAVDESKTADIVIPTVGVRMDFTPHPSVNLFAEISGMSAGKNGNLKDAEAGIRYRPVEFLSLTGGYRLLDIRAKDDPDYINIKLSGPYVGLNFHF